MIAIAPRAAKKAATASATATAASGCSVRQEPHDSPSQSKGVMRVRLPVGTLVGTGRSSLRRALRGRVLPVCELGRQPDRSRELPRRQREPHSADRRVVPLHRVGARVPLVPRDAPRHARPGGRRAGNALVARLRAGPRLHGPLRRRGLDVRRTGDSRRRVELQARREHGRDVQRRRLPPARRAA